MSRHDSVYGELLISGRGVRNRLLAAYDQMHDAPVVSHGDVVAFGAHGAYMGESRQPTAFLASNEAATNAVGCRSTRHRGRYQSACAVGVLIQAL